jgi:hypothetical protein
LIPEAKFLDVIGTKVLRVFLPPPLSKSGLKLVCTVNIVYGKLKTENSPDNLCPELSTKLYVHDFFGFCTMGSCKRVQYIWGWKQKCKV